MKGFIFAAGFGDRLRPLTDETPKPLLPVVNLPSICYAVSLLKEAGIQETIINLHYRSRDIIDFFKSHNNFGMEIAFSIEDAILGTGGGFKKCEHIIGDSDVLIVNSDLIIDLDVRPLLALHREKEAPATLVLRKTGEAASIGPVSVDGNRIIDFKNFLGTNKPSEYIYTGAGIVSPVIFDYLIHEFSSIVYTGYVELIKRHCIIFYEHTGYWHDIGAIESYWKANIDLMNIAGDGRISSMLELAPKKISPGAKISNSAHIVDSVIGEGAFIEDGAVVERSVLLPGSAVKAGDRVANSVVFKDQIFKIINDQPERT